LSVFHILEVDDAKQDYSEDAEAANCEEAAS